MPDVTNSHHSTSTGLTMAIAPMQLSPLSIIHLQLTEMLRWHTFLSIFLRNQNAVVAGKVLITTYHHKSRIFCAHMIELKNVTISEHKYIHTCKHYHQSLQYTNFISPYCCPSKTTWYDNSHLYHDLCSNEIWFIVVIQHLMS